jgi:hypothetical protein
VVILITPKTEGLFHIQVHKIVKRPSAGPLLNNMLVSKHALTRLLMATIINIEEEFIT